MTNPIKIPTDFKRNNFENLSSDHLDQKLFKWVKNR